MVYFVIKIFRFVAARWVSIDTFGVETEARQRSINSNGNTNVW